MAKANTISRKKILKAYVDYVSKKLKRPKSIKRLAKSIGVNEADILKYYTNFDDIEGDVYVYFMQRTHKLVSKEQFDSKHEFLLGLFFTFFEHLEAEKAYIDTISRDDYKRLEKLKTLKPLKKYYLSCLRQYDKEFAINLPQSIEKIRNHAIDQAAWAHFMFVFAFWLKDKSPDHIKTDMLIEKTLRVVHELENNQLANSTIDLGKFVFKEVKNSL